MDVYLLSLYVTLEQEIAIRELFVFKGWTFNKDLRDRQMTVNEQTFEPSQYCDRSDVSKFSINQTGSTGPDDDQGMVGTDVLSYLQDYVTAALGSEQSIMENEERDFEEICKNSESSASICCKKEFQENSGSETEVDDAQGLRLNNNNDLNKNDIIKKEKLEETIHGSQTVEKSCSYVKEENKCKQKDRFTCSECERSFKRLSAFEKHKINGKCVFVCEFCNKKYTSQTYSHYMLHMKYHTNDKSHICSECGKCFVEAHNLRKHMLRHTGKKTFQCEVCGNQFYESAQLTQHRNIFHKESNIVHKCDQCEAILSTAGNLKFHKEVVHSQERPWTCEICGKNFKTQKTLEKVHAKVHQDVYPFKCDFPGCGKVFKRSEGLLEHSRRHRNERTHVCDQCGKRFYNRKDLRLHNRIHTGVKPFACSLCPYKSTLAGNLRKHLKIHQS
ncbi:gastrula zinc finger protein XlCGF57.1-like [Dreissena polymorpha]|uniref:C2H2-type domain-containing protein n=1 Tax=Dreissena polymorpha TaxID=45954 RepID=A0A9D4C2Q5_DREPO|nr:gastrula zinc finger protein XlCGF57.1-like [Dreissena polymorpha]KAH3716079.1 hypothetical protein DPMN_058795 [Dreissena polymorpha]